MRDSKIAAFFILVSLVFFTAVAFAFEVRDACVCLDVQWGRAIQPMTIVRPENHLLYFHAYYSGNDRKREFAVNWNRFENGAKVLLFSDKITITHQDGHIDCTSHLKGSEDWLEGEYVVDLWEGDQILASVPFKVVKTSVSALKELE